MPPFANPHDFLRFADFGSLIRAGGGLGASAPTPLFSLGENNGPAPFPPRQRPPVISTVPHTRVTPPPDLWACRLRATQRERRITTRASPPDVTCAASPDRGCGGRLNAPFARSAPNLPTFGGRVSVADRRGLIRKYATPVWKFGRRLGTALGRSRSIKALLVTPLLFRIDLLTRPTTDRLSFHTHHQSTPNTLIAFYAPQAITSTTMTRAGHTLTTDHPGVSLDSRTLLSAQKARDQQARRSKAPPDIPRELHPFLSLSVGPSTMSNAVSRALSY
ncbi:hypothetical protein EV122DRAFT_256791, partial [Schizophyllum commune]